LIAAAIHNLSPRKERPLFTVKLCRASANLIESELFGREKGAFTGCRQPADRPVEVGQWFHLCLDEIGELPLDCSQLLRLSSIMS